MMNTTATNPPTWKKDVGIRATNDSALYYHIQRKGSSLPLECMNRSTEVIPPIRNTGILLTLQTYSHAVNVVGFLSGAITITLFQRILLEAIECRYQQDSGI